MPRYVTADAVAGIPTLAAVPADEHRQVLDDAGELLGWISVNQWATDGQLRSHFETEGWEPDRVSRALGVLCDTRHVLVFERRNQAIVDPPAAPATGQEGTGAGTAP